MVVWLVAVLARLVVVAMLAGCVGAQQTDEFALLDGLWTGTLESRVGAFERRKKKKKKKEKK
jgi:hypothetical protein